METINGKSNSSSSLNNRTVRMVGNEPTTEGTVHTDLPTSASRPGEEAIVKAKNKLTQDPRAVGRVGLDLDDKFLLDNININSQTDEGVNVDEEEGGTEQEDSKFTIPDDIVSMFFSFLDFRDLLKVALVCKQWNELSQQNFLWEALFNLRYPNPLLVNLHDEITHTLPLEKNHELRAQQLWNDSKRKLLSRLRKRSCADVGFNNSNVTQHSNIQNNNQPNSQDNNRQSNQPKDEKDKEKEKEKDKEKEKKGRDNSSALGMYYFPDINYKELFKEHHTKRTVCVAKLDENTALYRLEIYPFTDKKGHVYSEPFKVGNDMWRMLVFPEGNRCQSLSIYLDVAHDPNTLDKDFKKPTIYMFIILNRKQHSLTRMYYIEKNFSMADRRGEVIDWGLQETMDLQTLKNTPGYIVDDSLLVEVLLHVPEKPVIGTSKPSS